MTMTTPEERALYGARLSIISAFAMRAAEHPNLALRMACQHVVITWTRWAAEEYADHRATVSSDWTGPLDHLVSADTSVHPSQLDWAWLAAEALLKLDTGLL